MKSYILIQNDGEIESNSFELIGASTKRTEKGKIGFFGSGLKYSIAFMMRNKIDFRIFSGERELKFTTIRESLKDQVFERICIDGKPTSYTVTMGPTWTEDWFVLREVYCNALDEGSVVFVKDATDPSPSIGKTRIYIEITNKLREVLNSWDNYFSEDRTPIFSASKFLCPYIGTGDVNGSKFQDISVYSGNGGIVYRKGVAVSSKNGFLFDYGLEYVDINEDRTAKGVFHLVYTMLNFFLAFTNESYIKTVLRSIEDRGDKTWCTEYDALTYTHDGYTLPVSEKWVDFSFKNVMVVQEIAGRYQTELACCRQEDIYYLPIAFCRRLKKAFENIRILGMGNWVNGVGMDAVDASPKMNFLLKEVIASLKEMQYEIGFPVNIVDFHSEEQLGLAHNNEIYLSKKVFDLGRREIAMTLMEENEHLLSHAGDETRKFQTHIFSQWLKHMEDRHGLFL